MKSLDDLNSKIADLNTRSPHGATIAEYEAKLAALEAYPKRIAFIVDLARQRSIWIRCEILQEESIAFANEGPERWVIGGQGVGNLGYGKTLEQAIDAACTPTVTP